MEKLYIVPGWVTIVAGVVIHRDGKVLLGLRSARAEKDKWCLPTGLGAIRRDISSMFIAGAPESFADPMSFIQTMSSRHKQAFFSPGGFALAETKWYIDVPPDVIPDQLVPLNPICQLTARELLVKLYFGLKWLGEPPKPADTEWPFREVRFFSAGELKTVPVAFGCDKDLEEVFWKIR